MVVSRRLRRFALAACVSASACGPQDVIATEDAAVVTDQPSPFDAPDRPLPTDAPVVPMDLPRTPRDVPVTPVDLGDPGSDEAAITAAAFPMALGCSARATATVTVRNTGTSTWTAAAGYALGAVDDSDPFFTADTRVRLPPGVTVAPGATREFTIPLTSTGADGTFTTDWRMVRDGVHWFGATASQRVQVSCGTVAASDFRLSDVTIVSSPDVRSFPVTSRITELSFRPGTIHIDHTLRGTWPPVVIEPTDGTTQEATIWVFFRIGGRWYGTGGERLRPNQTDKALDNPSALGPDWLYDSNRWGVMTGYVPSPGELVGFMVVAGSTRSDDHVIARERTGVILVPFPADGVATTFPPFAGIE
jgi:hypothetical protein